MQPGGQVETLRPLRVNDRIQRVPTILDVKIRKGKAGALCFVSITQEISAKWRDRHS
jgi:hydroxyacyl-ACP dehydratase HTD2-like protein with hotdog domain